MPTSTATASARTLFRHESRNTYNDQGLGDDFMGPTLWTSDPEIFGYNPDAVEYLSDLFGMPVDLGSHIDMLHESPSAWASPGKRKTSTGSSMA